MQSSEIQCENPGLSDHAIHYLNDSDLLILKQAAIKQTNNPAPLF